MAAIRTRLKEVFRNLSGEFRSRNSDRDGEPENRPSETSDTPGIDHRDGGIRLDHINLEFPADDDESHDEMDSLEDLGNLNTIATGGNVFNIVNSSQVHCGPLHIIYNYGSKDPRKFDGHWASSSPFTPEPPHNKPQKGTRNTGHTRSKSDSSQSSHSSPQSKHDTNNDQHDTRQSEKPSTSRTPPRTSRSQSTEEEMTSDVKILMKSGMEPSHKYLKYISWNLGREWKHFYIVLGYKYNIIETFEIDTCRGGYSVSEARYQLLLDWMRSNDAGTLGQLSAALWNAGETDIVQHLAEIYKQEHLCT